MSELFDTLLLLALPASGKSEVRNFLAKKDPLAFHMGETVQLDDYPYVHLQLLVDEALEKAGAPRAFHSVDPDGGRNGPFLDPLEMPALIELLNEDYRELQAGEMEHPDNPAARLLERFDRASDLAGAAVKFRNMDAKIKDAVVEAIDAEARAFYSAKAAQFPKDMAGKTIVIEFARGGPVETGLPMAAGYGYAASLPALDPELLRRACVLYIWVDPEESLRKNRARARPDGHGSILFHGTPESVMRQEYGLCDMRSLIAASDRDDTLKIHRDDDDFYMPVAVFDNRTDLTTFARKDEKDWTDGEVNAVRTGLREATDRLWVQHLEISGPKSTVL